VTSGDDNTTRPGAPAGSVEAAVARRTAVLDTAHLGDIEGAFGRISVGETDRPRTLKVRLLTLLAIVGPGMIVMVGDNDAGGVATYAQAGQNNGYSLLWVLLLLMPVLIVNQEMVVRLGAVTGVGHARLINERFGRQPWRSFWPYLRPNTAAPCPHSITSLWRSATSTIPLAIGSPGRRANHPGLRLGHDTHSQRKREGRRRYWERCRSRPIPHSHERACSARHDGR